MNEKSEVRAQIRRDEFDPEFYHFGYKFRHIRVGEAGTEFNCHAFSIHQDVLIDLMSRDDFAEISDIEAEYPIEIDFYIKPKK